MKHAIGIDPGVNTGCAIWDIEKQQFFDVFSGSILQVLQKLEIYTVFGTNEFYIENPSLRKWYGTNANQKKQGAGSIKRDYSIWVEWFNMHNAVYFDLNPKNIRTKLNKQSFQTLTKWDGTTNQHSRDAAMMVFGINKVHANLHLIK